MQPLWQQMMVAHADARTLHFMLAICCILLMHIYTQEMSLAECPRAWKNYFCLCFSTVLDTGTKSISLMQPLNGMLATVAALNIEPS
jgi:hypothetical protein